jgi:hypothetical protein
MLLGLGRGPAGRGPPGRARSPWVPGLGRGPPGRGPPGRGPPPGTAVLGGAEAGAAGAPDCGALGAAPMPVAVELNGLLPGRGPGRGACRCPGAGGAVGRGAADAAGRSPVGMVSAGGTCGPTPGSCGNGTVTGAAGAAGRCAAGGSGGLISAAGASGSASAAGAAGVAAATCPFAAVRPLALDRAGAVFTAPSPACGLAACCEANASLSLRTTGASIVEDAERTNSPISLSLAMTALLSTPNSLASSYTRTFATALPLLGPATRTLSRPGQRVLRPASASAVHRRMLIGRSLQSQPLPSVQPQGQRPRTASVQQLASRRMPPGIPRPCRPAVPPAGEARAERLGDAGLVPSMPGSGAGMHPGQEAARRRRERSHFPLPPRGSARIWPRGLRTRRKSGSESAPPSQPAYRAGAASAPGRAPGSSSSGPAEAATGPASAVSARMSMRQPVSRAASRTFCPSFPIASES